MPYISMLTLKVKIKKRIGQVVDITRVVRSTISCGERNIENERG